MRAGWLLSNAARPTPPPPSAVAHGAQVDVEQCPAGLSHNSVAKCVIDAMASTERLALLRLTAVCASVHAALSAACGALTR